MTSQMYAVQLLISNPL